MGLLTGMFLFRVDEGGKLGFHSYQNKEDFYLDTRILQCFHSQKNSFFPTYLPCMIIIQDENFPELCSTFLSFQTQKLLGHPLPTAPKGRLPTMESILKALSWCLSPGVDGDYRPSCSSSSPLIVLSIAPWPGSPPVLICILCI